MNIQIEEMTLKHFDLISKNLLSNFDNFWNPNILENELKSDNSIYFIAKNDNDEIIGFVGIKVVLNDADLMNIVVKKDFRNTGIASLLLKYILNYCNNNSINSIILEVSEENIHAIKLYEKFGFDIISSRDNYYKDKKAIIMKKKIV